MSEYLTKADTRLFAGFGPLTGSTFTFDYYKEKVADKAKKGDLCVILPIHGEPYNLMNIPEIVLGLTLGIGDLDHRSWGHSGMFTRDVTKDMQYDNKEVVDSIMFGAIIEGVHYETIDNWLTESYILEIKKLEYTWNPASNNPLTVNRSEYSQQERDKFIEIATSYEGTIFVESYTDDFLTGYLFIKDVIPDTFHCSGLIWWTALQAYGIDLSIPFLRTVSPSRLILNPYTDIKVVLE
ncbi:MAG: hypothetical protein MJY71_01200 [Bacteroidaceae bacterium]|nr:hypothetical protein [Bacteroidaceae bacterium]